VVGWSMIRYTECKKRIGTERVVLYLSILAGIVHLVFVLFLRVPLSEFVADRLEQCAWNDRAWLSVYDLYREGGQYRFTTCIPCCVYLPAGLLLFSLAPSGKLTSMLRSNQFLWSVQIAVIVMGALTVLYVSFWILIAVGCPRGNDLVMQRQGLWSLCSLPCVDVECY
jgi:hypothetical protein